MQISKIKLFLHSIATKSSLWNGDDAKIDAHKVAKAAL